MEKKNNSGLLVGIILGLVIAAIIGVALYSSGTISFNNKSANNNKETNNNSIKINELKDYVYDAEYKYNNKYTEYNRNGTEKIEDSNIDYYGISVKAPGIDYLKNLKVPYININSRDAQIANNEMEYLYLKYAKDFDSYAEENNNQTGPSCSQILTYRTYKYNNILSVITIDSIACTSPYVFNYNVYNFDLTTGNKLSYNEMLSKLGYKEENVLENIKKTIKEKMEEIYKNNPEGDLSKACHYAHNQDGTPKYDTTDCFVITYQLFESSIKDNRTLYLTDNDGNLNILPILYIDFAQNGDRNRYLVKVTK